MDAAILGAVIGISLMGCMMGARVCYEKREKWKKFFKRFRRPFKRTASQQTSLIPIAQQNPILVRVSSKQFQMKDLL